MDYNKISNVVMSEVNIWDFPDFCDAYVESAEYRGVEMTEDQIQKLNEDGDFLNEKALESLN